MSTVISLNDKLRFNARQDLERNAMPIPLPATLASHQTLPLTNMGSIKRGTLLRSMRQRTPPNGVVFQPIYHKNLKREEKFVFSSPSSLQDSHDKIVFLHRSDIKNPSKPPPNGTTEVVDQAHPRTHCPLPPFQTHSKPLGTNERDRITKAKFSYGPYATHPYANITPYDHRDLSCCFGDTKLVTCVTPDPFDIRFKNHILSRLLKDQVADCCDVRLPRHSRYHAQFNTRRTPDPQFNTRRTPDPQFPSNLYFNKGCYSPAFTAHSAYLDRIADGIKPNK